MQKLGELANVECAIVRLPTDRHRDKQADKSASTGWTFKTLSFASDRWVIEATRINGPCFLLCGAYSSPSAAAKAISKIARRLADLKPYPHLQIVRNRT